MTLSLIPAAAHIIVGTARLIALIGLVAATPACAQKDAGDSAAQNSNLDQKLAVAYENLERRGFNGVVAVAPSGMDPIIKGFGANASAAGVPDSQTLVDTGSITKTITAAAVLKLVDEGKLATSDRLSKYFPDAPEDKADITIHQLLTHSAGFPGAVAEDDETVDRATFVARAMNADLLSPPGSAYYYSNVGYSLVAAIIEDISGQSYEYYVRETLIGGHDQSSIGYGAAFDPARSLLTRDGKTIRQFSWGGGDPYWALIGNGGLIATAKDMIEFRRLFANGALVSSAAIILRKPHWSAKAKTRQAILVMAWSSKTIRHSGAFIGIMAVMRNLWPTGPTTPIMALSFLQRPTRPNSTPISPA